MTTYTEAVDRVRETFDPKIRELIDEVSTALTFRGWSVKRCGTDLDSASDEYVWWGPVLTLDNRECSVSVTLVEQLAREGCAEGISFKIEVGNDQEAIWIASPGNYSPMLVVPVWDAEAVAARWEAIEGLVPYLLETVEEWAMEESA